MNEFKGAYQNKYRLASRIPSLVLFECTYTYKVYKSPNTCQNAFCFKFQIAIVIKL